MGLKPRLIDSYPNNYNISLKQFLNRVTKKTKAALIAHIMVKLHKFMKFVKKQKRKIKIIEDAVRHHLQGVYGAKNIPYVIKNLLAHLGILVFFYNVFKNNFIKWKFRFSFYKNKKLYRNVLSHADRGKQIWRKT